MQKSRLTFAVFLFPLSLVYGTVVCIRNLFFDLGILRSVGFPLPVISVGNLTAGGTGKTPHVEYLISLLKERYRIAVLSRGYKRKSKGFQLAVTTSTVKEIGDELKQIHNRFPEVIVAADGNRVEGINQLLAKFHDLEAVVLDDAFQHRYVNPGLSVVLVDHARPVFRDFLLPMGNLRETPCNINRADVVIVSKCPRGMKESQRKEYIERLRLRHRQPVYFTHYQYGNIIPVFEASVKEPVMHQDLKTGPCILLVTGIADVRPLKDHLGQFASDIDAISFADHHSYKPADIRVIEQKFAALPADRKIIITTLKDATKFREMRGELDRISAFLYYIPIEVKFQDDGEKNFNKLVMNFCAPKPSF